jgi:hypothetical protein
MNEEKKTTEAVLDDIQRRAAAAWLTADQKQIIFADICTELELMRGGQGPYTAMKYSVADEFPDAYIGVACSPVFSGISLPESLHECFGTHLKCLHNLWEPKSYMLPDPCPVEEEMVDSVTREPKGCAQRHDGKSDFQCWLDLKREIALHRDGMCSAKLPHWATLKRVE